MKYYSETLKKFYETEADCVKAEKEAAEKAAKAKAEQDKKAAERKDRAAEVDKAYREAIEATKKYKTLLNAFVKDYNSYHRTYSINGAEALDLLSASAFDFLF